MKLIKLKNIYHLVSNDDLNTRDWALRPDGVVLKMTDTDMIDYLDSESTATKKIIASTEKLDFLPLINKINVERIISEKPSLKEMAEMRYGSSPEGAKCRSKWINGYSQCLEDNLNNFTKEDMLLYASWVKSRVNSFPNEKLEESLEDFLLRGRDEKTEWDVEVEMGTYAHVGHGFVNDGNTYPIETVEKLKIDDNGYINVLRKK